PHASARAQRRRVPPGARARPRPPRLEAEPRATRSSGATARELSERPAFLRIRRGIWPEPGIRRQSGARLADGRAAALVAHANRGGSGGGALRAHLAGGAISRLAQGGR